MFAKIAAFEFRYQIRQPLFWIAFVLFFLLTFGSIVADQIQIGSAGNVAKNSPFALIQTMLIMSIFGMFATTAFVANVIVRDDETGFGGIVGSTPVHKGNYLFGRFAGAATVAFLVSLAVPLAVAIGAMMPWLDPEKIIPFKPDHYLFATFVMAAPNFIFTAALFFCVATLTRSMMASYVAMTAFLVAYIVAISLMQTPDAREIVSYVEPFGIGAFSMQTRYWTVAQRNADLPMLTGALLVNRVGVLTLAGVALAGAYAFFRFEKRAAPARSGKSAKADRAPLAARAPRLAPEDRAGIPQFLARTRFETSEVVRNPAFLVLMLIGCLNALGGLMTADEMFGTPIYAVTRVMVETVRGAFTIFPILIAIYYGGELVWRERDKRVHEIIGASPAPDWSLVVPKIIALTLVLTASMLVATLTAFVVQLVKQAPINDAWNYVSWYVAPNAVATAQIAALAVFVQTLTPNKFIGYGVMMVYLVATMVASIMGLDHNLLVYAGSPPEPLSDMNGAGYFQSAANWFRAYWSAVALALLTLSFVLWRRGADVRLAPRLARAPRRLAGGAGLVFGGSLVAAAAFGGYAFYNTNVLNAYRGSTENEKWAAAFEKKYLANEKLPQPTIADVALDVSVRPRDLRANVKGSYVLENRTGSAISDVHVRLARDVQIRDIALVGARLKSRDDRFNYLVFGLEAPMQSGERRTLTFSTVAGQRGFKNSDNTTRVVENGTFLNNFEFAPVIGIGREQLLTSREVRRRNGLPADLRPPKLEDSRAKAHHYLRHDSDWVNARIRIETDADQTAIAPGRLVSENVADGRRIVEYVTDAPVQNFFSIQSARYVVKRDTWRDVDLAVYYHPAHAYNVDRMLKAMRESLEYYSTNFSPYQFKQARILEFPAYASFAQAFANTMPYSEAIGFIADARDPDAIDYPTYVTAHEVAHQWWAHQVIGADMQGSTLLSETLAQYSALMVMKKIYGADQIRRFLKFELDGYLRRRGGEAVEELPLARVENQPYVHYNKGSLVMYLLQDEIGEATVNRALSRFVQAHGFKAAPYPRSSDLIAILREEAEPGPAQALITDLFEKITLYDLKATNAKATRRADGLVDVTFMVDASKAYADGAGAETPAPLSETMDVGVFTSEPGRGAFKSSDVVVMERRLVPSGASTMTLRGLKVARDATTLFVGIDPYNKRIDRNSSDNLTKASLRAGGSS
jgi:ABC-type transport system involved in multi-copper enzyme maturation permease subunit